MTLRTFIAVDPSPEVVGRLAESIRTLERKTKGFRWVRPEALHLTLRFLGEIEEGVVDEIDARLKQLVPEFTPMSLKVSGLGFFPGPEKPRIVWAGLYGEIGRLGELQARVHEGVGDLPVHQEKDREFQPHLTLARIPNWRGSTGVTEILKAAPGADFGEFVADRVFLYKSRLTPEGASYTKLKEYRLGRN